MKEQTSLQRHRITNERSLREIQNPGLKQMNYASRHGSLRLCGDCDVLNYCQYARNLSHNHTAHIDNQRIINRTNAQDKQNNPIPNVVDQHIMAERLKLRHKTCPFHRELSLG